MTGRSSTLAAVTTSSIAELGGRAKRASRQLATASTAVKDSALNAAADLLVDRAPEVLEANAADVARAEGEGVTSTVVDRLRLMRKQIGDLEFRRDDEHALFVDVTALVTDTGRMVVKHHGNVVADIPASKLANEAPVYQRDFCEPNYLKAVREFTLASVPDTKDPLTALKTLLAWPTIASIFCLATPG